MRNTPMGETSIPPAVNCGTRKSFGLVSWIRLAVGIMNLLSNLLIFVSRSHISWWRLVIGTGFTTAALAGVGRVRNG